MDTRPAPQGIAVGSKAEDRLQGARPVRHPELAVVPGSRLAIALMKLQRPERRMLLAIVQMPRTPRKVRMQRELNRRLAEKGISL